jgi:dienelactone hydrolase
MGRVERRRLGVNAARSTDGLKIEYAARPMQRAFPLAVMLLIASCAPSEPPRPQTQAGAPTRTAALPPADPAPPPYAERVRFPSLDADLTHAGPTMLDGLVIRPEGAGPFPAVVALHGCSGLYGADGRLSAREDEWARHLRDQGYAVLLPDSLRPRGVTDICRGPIRTIHPGAERARDAYGALAYLQTQSYVAGDRIALLGWSHGGLTVLWTIGDGSKARPTGLAHDFRAAIAFYPSCDKVYEQERWHTKIPLEILIGELDNWTPAAPCMQLTERSRAAGMLVETVVYRNAYHDFDTPGLAVHEVRGLNSAPHGRATVGTEPTGRADAFKRIPEILALRLGTR